MYDISVLKSKEKKLREIEKYNTDVDRVFNYVKLCDFTAVERDSSTVCSLIEACLPST